MNIGGHADERASAREARMSSGAAGTRTRGADELMSIGARMRGADELTSIGGRAVPGLGGQMSSGGASVSLGGPSARRMSSGGASVRLSGPSVGRRMSISGRVDEHHEYPRG